MEQEPVRKEPGLLELLDKWEKQGASDAEIVRRARKYLGRRAREKGVPIHGTFEVTPLCNLDCKMCYVHLSEAQLRETDERLLTVDEWKNIMQQAIDAGMTVATLTGGECLTYSGFDELYLFLQAQAVSVNVKTNGLLLTEKRIDFFKAHIPLGLQVTLYGSDDDTYEKVTGRRCFAQVINAIKSAKDAQLPISVTITPNRYMRQNFESLLTCVHNLGIAYQISSGLFLPREETGRAHQSHDLTLDEYIEMYRIEAKLKNRTLTPVCAEEIQLSEQSQKPVVGFRCGAGRDGFAVDWRGRMAPCLTFRDISVDLRQREFETGWKEIHNAVLTYPVPRECVGCIYRPLCSPCVVQHAYGAPPGHANPVFCERARRLVSEGIAMQNKEEKCSEEAIQRASD